MKTAIFPGTFDPFTKGHADIVARGLEIFDRIVIAVGINENKQPAEGTDTRLSTIDALYANDDRVGVCAYTGLTVDFALEQDAQFILRGVRSMKDYEYERSIADMNYRLSGVETVLLFSRPELASISSSLVREIEHNGRDISEFLP